MNINSYINSNIHDHMFIRLDKWMLDMTEGPSRMRKKMKKNDLFYLHYPYRPELDSGDNVSGQALVNLLSHHGNYNAS